MKKGAASVAPFFFVILLATNAALAVLSGRVDQPQSRG